MRISLGVQRAAYSTERSQCFQYLQKRTSGCFVKKGARGEKIGKAVMLPSICVRPAANAVNAHGSFDSTSRFSTAQSFLRNASGIAALLRESRTWAFKRVSADRAVKRRRMRADCTNKRIDDQTEVKSLASATSPEQVLDARRAADLQQNGGLVRVSACPQPNSRTLHFPRAWFRFPRTLWQPRQFSR